MGSLDDATTDNTSQEATLATIRSVSGDWDNSNVVVTTTKGVSSFTSSGTFTAPTGCTSFEVQLWGAGGGGAMRRQQSGSSADGYGGGGGAYTLTTVNSVTAAEAYTVTIGSAGAGGANSGYIQSGSAGGSSSFVGRNVNMTSGGGNGGTASSGTGGSGSGGMIEITGESGFYGSRNDSDGGNDYRGGFGGAAPFSGGRSVNSHGGDQSGEKGHGMPNPGIFPGGGGSTRHTYYAGSGGDGAAGFCIVRW